MLYSPIKNQQNFESLIRIGETPESVHWDYKQTFNLKEPDAIAIDLAAFANTYGGTLLIGVAEKKENGLKVASGFVPNVDAEEIKKQVNTRIHEIISPKIDATVVQFDIADNVVVAINVEPSVNLVGVCLDKDRRSFCFPYRTEYGNRYMSFEEVEKRMMDNKTRATYLKLKKHIPSKGKVTIYPFPIGNYRAEWFAEWIFGLENEIRLSRSDFRYNSIVVPLTYIDEVWNGSDGVCIKMNTRLFCSPNFIDFEDSEKVTIYRTMEKNWIEAQRIMNHQDHKK